MVPIPVIQPVSALSPKGKIVFKTYYGLTRQGMVAVERLQSQYIWWLRISTYFSLTWFCQYNQESLGLHFSTRPRELTIM